jgi:uncharacterized protein (DUF983 family)
MGLIRGLLGLVLLPIKILLWPLKLVFGGGGSSCPRCNSGKVKNLKGGAQCMDCGYTE